MKTLNILILAIIFSFKVQAQTTVVTSTVSVKGNCDDCKERIENAADIKGVKNSNWDKDKKVLTVTFDSKKVTLVQIEEAIAKAGHTTATKTADAKAYNKLPDCCKYEQGACKEK